MALEKKLATGKARLYSDKMIGRDNGRATGERRAPKASAPAPPAEGQRAPWDSLDAEVLRGIESHFGSAVHHTNSRAGGFSPGIAAAVWFDNGQRAFVKATSAAHNPSAPGIYRREAQVARSLPAVANAPRLLWDYDDGSWVVLALEYIDGWAPSLPWRGSQLSRLLTAIGRLAEDLTPSPVDVPSAPNKMKNSFQCWHELANAGSVAISRLAEASPWAADNIEGLAELETRSMEATAGQTLVHGDIRADNVLFTAQRVVFVDWPHACTGAAWLDLLLLLPSVAMQGGPGPAEIFDAHPLGRRAPSGDATAALCALAGYFLWNSVLPAPPGLPTLRAFQRAQGLQAVAWLEQRLGGVDL